LKFINQESYELLKIPANSELFANEDDFIAFNLNLADNTYFENWISNTENFHLSIPHQKILYGSPGTGKSTKIKKLIAEHGFEVARTTFHPDTDYHSFVGGYKPVVQKDSNNQDYITYSFVPQIFTKMYVKAHQNPDKNHLLVIEELNRGNCAQIFGDIFQCLDRNDAGFSEYPIEADTDLANYLNALGLSPQLTLPSNLYIYATMNTSDQSLFPMDSAFKRRWDWQYVPIDYAKASEMKIEIGDIYYNWGQFTRKVNDSIEDVTESEDKQIGNFFVKADKPNGIISIDAFKSKVMFYLWSEIYKNQVRTGKTIFEYQKDDKTDEFTFSKLFEEGEDLQILPLFMAKLKVEPLP
jgi:5-methylcytosine-specific restriction endonuclease McrBC GTP-binding regulatory subunit McrB